MTASDDDTARVWDTATGLPLTPPLRMGGGVHGPKFSKDGRLVLAGNGLVVQVWDSSSGLPVTPAFHSPDPMLDIAFSADERKLLAVTSDGRVLAWDITPVDWPLHELAAAARLLSCREIDATGAPVPLEQLMENRDRPAAPLRANALDSSHGKDEAARLSEPSRHASFRE